LLSAHRRRGLTLPNEENANEYIAEREIDQELSQPGAHPDRSTVLTRRTFLHKSLLYGTTGAAAYGLFFPLINTIDIAFAQGGQSFKFAWISDTHLYPKAVNKRFVEKATRAIQEVQAMNPPADFLIFGGDMAQLGDPVELQLGAELLKEVTIKKVFIPGEHDCTWIWVPPGTRCSARRPGLSITRGPLRRTGYGQPCRGLLESRKMSAKERMGNMATLDGTLGGPGPQWAPSSSSGLTVRWPVGARTSRW